MKLTHANTNWRRAELIAELFLQDLHPQYIAKSMDDLGYDFLVGFQNGQGGIDTYAVEVKATEKTVAERFPLDSTVYQRLSHSNIPSLLLVINVKENRLYYAWLKSSPIDNGKKAVPVPVKEIDETVKEKLRKELFH